MAAIEDVLELYAEPYDSRRTVVCFDETSTQLLAETRTPAACGGRDARGGRTTNTLGPALAICSPPAIPGRPFDRLRRRHVAITQRLTMQDFAHQMRWPVNEAYPDAPVVRLVLDNLNTHRKPSMYEALPPSDPRRIAKRLEFTHTPLLVNWLNPVLSLPKGWRRSNTALWPGLPVGRNADWDGLKRAVNAYASERNAAADGFAQ